MSTKCRRCRMPIPDNALKCPYCHEDPGTPASIVVQVYKQYGCLGALIFIIVVLALLIAIFYFFGRELLGPSYDLFMEQINRLF